MHVEITFERAREKKIKCMYIFFLFYFGCKVSVFVVKNIYNACELSKLSSSLNLTGPGLLEGVFLSCLNFLSNKDHSTLNES